MTMEVDSDRYAAELEADLKEYRAMLVLAKRENVRKVLEHHITEAEAKLARGSAAAPDAAVAAPAKPSPAAPAAVPEKAAPPPAKPHVPVQTVVKSAGPWTEITTFALDLGGYDKPLITVDVRLKGIENLPSENVTCDFTEASFDLKIVGLDGQNYRFLRTNLDKDIIPSESNVKVKKNHVIITLQKVKGEYGYDSWTDLCAKGKRKPTATKKDANPQDSIMGMMKDLYEDGDDNMKKIIGEAMYKARSGEKYDPKADDMKLPSFDEKMEDV